MWGPSIAIFIFALVILLVPKQSFAAPTYTEYLDACKRSGVVASQCGSQALWNSWPDSEKQRRFDAYSQNAETAKKNQEKFKKGEVDCTATKDYWFNLPTCLMRAALSWIGAGFVWIGVTLATIASGIFEASMTHLIVNFGYYINQYLKPGIDQGWTALRDIANIVIIGLFVFIAINIILGVEEFGKKKLVARVLVVAVLINFSLLFTKMIVDASNFTAFQFYNQMVKGISGTVDQTAQAIPGVESAKAAQLKTSGITGKFMQVIGITGIAGADQQKLRKIAEANQDALTALGYGLLVMVFMLALSLVLLYGAFLIISRAILIIFLMLTSALAFAAWLIPHQFVEQRFEQWWKSLLKSAFLAPILMAFLWMTLIVSDKVKDALAARGEGSGGMLGALAMDPSGEAHTVMLLNFIFILGLLYVSFKAASMFSNSISGFRFAAAGVGGTLSGASRLGGLLGRNVLGWPATLARSAMRNYMFAPGRPERRRGIRGYLGRATLRATDFASRSSFDVLRAKPLEKLAETIGTPKGLIAAAKKAGEGGIEGVLERKARRADELARRIGPTAGQRAEMEQQAQQQIDQQRQIVGQMRQTAETNFRRTQTRRPEAEAKVASHEEMRQRIENERAATVSRQRSEMRLEQERIARAQRDAEVSGATPEEIERLREPLRVLQEAQQRELDALNERARQHREDLETARETVQALNREAAEAASRDQRVVEAERALREMGTAEEQVRAADIQLREQMLWDKRAQPFVPDEMRGQQRRRDLRILAEEIQRGAPPRTPPTPPPAPPTT